MIAQHEQQHDETMLTTHQLSQGAPALPRRRRPPPPADAPGCRARSRARRPVRHGYDRRAVGAGQRAPRAPGRRGAVLPRHGAGDQRRRTRSSSPTAATTSSAGGPRPAGAPAAGGPGRPAVLAPGRRPWLRGPVRRHRAGAAGRAGAARVLVRGRRLRPLGRAPAAHRGRVGVRRRFDPVDRRVPPLPVGGRGPGPRPGQPRPAVPTAGAGRRRIQGRGAVRRPAAHRRRVGVDLERFPAVSRLLRLAVPGVLGGVLRQRVQGAARRVLRGQPGGLPGTFRNWDYPVRRQIFAGFRTAPGTPRPTTDTGWKAVR